MASPGIKISELTQYADGEIGTISGFNSSAQKLLLAYQANNYQVPLSTLSSTFIERDFSKSENHLSSTWNFQACEIQANNPIFPIDVANGNTLSALQAIFDLFPQIWPFIRPPFINICEPRVTVVRKGTQWIQRDNGGREYIGKFGGIHYYSVPQSILTSDVGVNQISANGGYWFPEKNVYMQNGEALTDDSPTGQTYLELLGWTDDREEPMKLIRYRIDPTSRVGAAFNATYIVHGGEDSQRGRGGYIVWNDKMPIRVKYAGVTAEETIAYMGGKRYSQNDGSKYLNNEWWGEGMANNPEIKGAQWSTWKTTPLLIESAGDNESLHGAEFNLMHYSVEVIVEEVTITQEQV